MAPNNLFALARAFQVAFATSGPKNIETVLQKNKDLLSAYYYSGARDWKKLVRPNNENYSKVWLNMDTIAPERMIHGAVYSRKHPFGIAILTWMPYQQTGIHNHPEYGCIMLPLQGILVEERFSLSNESLPQRYTLQTKNNIPPGQSTFINDKMGYHRVINPHNTIAVSLHVYSPGPY